MKKKILVAIVTVFALCIFAFSSAVSAIVSKNGSITLHVADSTTG